MKPGQKVSDDRKLYAVLHFRIRTLPTRKPGTVWNWHGARPWWANGNQTIRKERTR